MGIYVIKKENWKNWDLTVKMNVHAQAINVGLVVADQGAGTNIDLKQFKTVY